MHQYVDECRKAHEYCEMIHHGLKNGMTPTAEEILYYFFCKEQCSDKSMANYWGHQTTAYTTDKKCLTQEELKSWVSHMDNKDGTTGHHWTMEQTSAVVKQHGLEVDECEWWVVMNMMYSDHWQEKRDDIVYIGLAKDFVVDADTVCLCEKLYWYYHKIAKHS